MSNGLIHLIGFSGAGKSACAPFLARLTARHYVELDDQVALKAGMGQRELFARFGQDYYRTIETRVLADTITRFPQHILVTGGGTVLLHDNQSKLRKSGKVVYLSASPAVIQERLQSAWKQHPAAEPLLRAIDASGLLERIYEFREPYYLAVSDVVVDTNLLSPPLVAIEIARALGEEMT